VRDWVVEQAAHDRLGTPRLSGSGRGLALTIEVALTSCMPPAETLAPDPPMVGRATDGLNLRPFSPRPTVFETQLAERGEECVFAFCGLDTPLIGWHWVSRSLRGLPQANAA
jgi:hypothetical protein